MTTAPDFEAALVDLQDHLPSWLETRTEGSVIFGVLASIGFVIDELSWIFERIFLDSALSTATEEGLLRNFAVAWGLEHEQLPSTVEQLREYIAALAESDGSLQGLVATLFALLNSPQNNTGGAILTFPEGGGGLTFPANGEGLQMFEFLPGEGPTAGLFFPADGSGLKFPVLPSILPSDHVIGRTGGIPPGAGPGLIFSQNQFVAVKPNTPGVHQFTVEVLNWLEFDRGAFRRAVERYQPADCLPAIIKEVTVLE